MKKIILILIFIQFSFADTVSIKLLQLIDISKKTGVIKSITFPGTQYLFSGTFTTYDIEQGKKRVSIFWETASLKGMNTKVDFKSILVTDINIEPTSQFKATGDSSPLKSLLLNLEIKELAKSEYEKLSKSFLSKLKTSEEDLKNIKIILNDQLVLNNDLIKRIKFLENNLKLVHKKLKPKMIITTSSAWRIRSYPNTSDNTIVRAVKRGTILRYEELLDNGWYLLGNGQYISSDGVEVYTEPQD